MTYFQAIVIGALQGISELFPVSSLGHSVLLPAFFGWDNVVTSQSASESSFLAFIVGLHVATAIALLIYFRADWARIIRGFFRTLRTRRAETTDERMAWLLVVGTIPVGLTGLLLEHPLRTLFAKPLAAACFLTINGLILFAGEHLRRRSVVRHAAIEHGGSGEEPTRRLDTLEYREAGVIGVFQTFALLAGISRSGITMVAGLATRARPRGRGALLVPARDADHPGRRPLQAAGPARAARQRDPRPSARGEHCPPA